MSEHDSKIDGLYQIVQDENRHIERLQREIASHRDWIAECEAEIATRKERRDRCIASMKHRQIEVGLRQP